MNSTKQENRASGELVIKEPIILEPKEPCSQDNSNPIPQDPNDTGYQEHRSTRSQGNRNPRKNIAYESIRDSLYQIVGNVDNSDWLDVVRRFDIVRPNAEQGWLARIAEITLADPMKWKDLRKNFVPHGSTKDGKPHIREPRYGLALALIAEISKEEKRQKKLGIYGK